MTPLKAEAFRTLLSSLRDSIGSLTSCHAHEVPNESRVLRNVMEEVRAAVLVRRSPELEARRVDLLAHAEAKLASRSCRLA